MVPVLFITFIICLFIGVPVAFSLGFSALAYFLGANMPIATFSQRFFAGLDSFTLLCIPGFTLAGNLMNQGGISDKLMDFCDKLVGHLTGGMAYANIMASMIFAGISGTALSDTVALGGIEIPMMVDLGYDADFSVAVTAASSCMGPIIPPSLPMIMAATMTGLSVSKMFMAGIVPGLLLGFGMCATCYVLSVKRHYPKRDKHASLAHVLHATKEAIWALIMVAIILFGIMGGIVTPTEASIICVVYGLFVSVFIYRKMGPKEMYSCLRDTVSSASAIMALVAFANVFAFILTKEHIPSMIADAMLRLTSNKYLILLLINLFLIFVGMFMETIAAIRAVGCQVGISIKPGTPAEAVYPYLDDLDLVLVMSVEPGFGGQKFMPSALDKLSALRAERDRRGLHTLLEVDGGVNTETGPQCAAAGADWLVTGSALFKAKDPAAVIDTLHGSH